MYKEKYELRGDFIDRYVLDEDGNLINKFHSHTLYHYFHIDADKNVVNDGDDKTKVKIKIVNGLEVVNGTEPTDATVLDYDGDMILSIDGVKTTKTVTSGTVSFDVATEKPAGSTIEIVAESLADYPAKSDSAEIEVIEG